MNALLAAWDRINWLFRVYLPSWWNWMHYYGSGIDNLRD